METPVVHLENKGGIFHQPLVIAKLPYKPQKPRNALYHGLGDF